LGAAALASAFSVQGQSRKLQLGVIGCGWYGGVDLKAAYEAGDVECSAICDVDDEQMTTFAATVEKVQSKKPAQFKDYRKMLAAGGFDALIIATPPHWHALQYIDAAKAKIPTYLEKPMAYDPRECQAMVKAWKETGTITQVGFQRRKSDAFQAVKKYLAEGNAGKIVQVDAQIHYTAGAPEDKLKVQPVPASLDWETWCGPAPLLEYRPHIARMGWRLEKHIGNGHLVDWGIHLIDAARVMMGETMPRAFESMGGLYHYAGKITTPDTLSAQMDFAYAPLTWRHRLWGAVEYAPEFSNGVFFFGEKETVFVTDGRWVVMPKGRDAQRRETKATVQGNAMQVAHLREFLDAVRDKRQPSCTPEDAAMSTASVQLATLAYDVKSRLEWDASAWQVRNHPMAARMVKREYRKGLKHPWA
jgi:predicted dehydrogenase